MHSVWAASQPACWRIGNLYLMGSIHLGHPQLYPLPTALLQQFRHSQHLIVEVDDAILPNMANLQQNSPSTLSRPLQQALTQAAQQRGLANPAFDALPPWLALMSLMQFELKHLGWSPELGIDHYLMAQARQQGIPIQPLERVEQQLQLLQNLDANTLVASGLADLAKLPQQATQLMQFWQRGDLHQLTPLVLSEFQQSPELYQSLLVQRNQAWLKQLPRYILAKQSSFMVVGMAHLLGESGLIQQLKRQGYSVQRMPW
jgi:uncharacterized protein